MSQITPHERIESLVASIRTNIQRRASLSLQEISELTRDMRRAQFYLQDELIAHKLYDKDPEMRNETESHVEDLEETYEAIMHEILFLKRILEKDIQTCLESKSLNFNLMSAFLSVRGLLRCLRQLIADENETEYIDQDSDYEMLLVEDELWTDSDDSGGDESVGAEGSQSFDTTD
ncbi:hypothetical protein NLJ89_g678 [Agrocybe chaxingu]|uniref:Uncharacterized protein n=1 Tax=Agrocybe chaxingu TaxID=84603 RepID=A0A9W8TEP9_9AGAR|nr:hypothetical protein NLJ89_g678 [Agrocybe chaxingu]